MNRRLQILLLVRTPLANMTCGLGYRSRYLTFRLGTYVSDCLLKSGILLIERKLTKALILRTVDIQRGIENKKVPLKLKHEV